MNTLTAKASGSCDDTLLSPENSSAKPLGFGWTSTCTADASGANADPVSTGSEKLWQII